jgi:hypothetical protein
MFADPKTRGGNGEQPRLPLAYYEQTVPVPPGWDAQRHVTVTDAALPPAGSRCCCTSQPTPSCMVNSSRASTKAHRGVCETEAESVAY